MNASKSEQSLAVAQERIELIAEARILYGKMLLLHDKIQKSQSYISAAETGLRTTTSRFKRSEASLFSLLEAKDALLAAKLNFYRFVSSYENGIAKLERIGVRVSTSPKSPDLN
jgi:hypothetical protein